MFIFLSMKMSLAMPHYNIRKNTISLSCHEQVCLSGQRFENTIKTYR